MYMFKTAHELNWSPSLSENFCDTEWNVIYIFIYEMTTVQVSNWDEEEKCTLMERSLSECFNMLRGKGNISTIQPLATFHFPTFRFICFLSV